MAAERTLLDEEWKRLTELKQELAAEKKKFAAEKAAFSASGGAAGGSLGPGNPTPNEFGEYKLFVGNLSQQTTDDEELKKIFDQFGTVKECHILKDRIGKSKRSAFVKYGSRAEADAAIEGISDKIKDKDEPQCIVVRYARKKNFFNRFGAGAGVYGQRAAFGADQFGYGQAAMGGMGMGMGVPQQGFQQGMQQGFAATQQTYQAGYGGQAAQAGIYGQQQQQQQNLYAQQAAASPYGQQQAYTQAASPYGGQQAGMAQAGMAQAGMAQASPYTGY